MKLPARGSCQCGEVKFVLSGEPLLSYACHCNQCQKRTGSAFSMGLMILAEHLECSGDMSTYQRESSAGEINTRYSCARCGNVIYGVGSATVELLKLQPGTLDISREIEPEAHIWMRSSQHWVKLPEGVPRFDTQPADLLEVLSAAQAYRESKRA